MLSGSASHGVVHDQARAGPVGSGVEAGSGGFLANLAIGRDRAVDQSRIDREKVSGGDLQALAHRQGKVGDEDVGRAHQAVEHRETLRHLEVDGEAPLVAGRQLPPVVHGLAGNRR